VLTERVFSLNGLGKYAIDAITNNDLPKVMGAVLFSTTFIIIANLIVDLLYAVVDPKVRIG
jgi:peptide/nickel transport system permease protein